MPALLPAGRSAPPMRVYERDAWSLRRAVNAAVHARHSRAGAALLAAGLATAWASPATSAPYLPEESLAAFLPTAGGDGSKGFVIEGMDAGDYAGQRLSPAGDVNGDGIPDLLVSAASADNVGRQDVGEAYVVFGRDDAQGRTFPPVLALSSLLPENGGDGSKGFVLQGIDAGDRTGTSISDAGDVNGDGVDDLVIGAPYADPGGRDDAGESYVVFGRDSAHGAGFPPVLELSSLLPINGGDGTLGFVMNGGAHGEISAFSVSKAGDVNGDGIADLIVGAKWADFAGKTNSGSSYVVFGRDASHGDAFPPVLELTTLTPQGGGDGSAGFVILGADVRDYSGFAVNAAGDVNGDGVGDVIIGAWGATPDTREHVSESYVVFGRDTGQAGNFSPTFSLAALFPANGGDGSLGFVLQGTNADDNLGQAVSGTGDINGDGIDDLIVGASGADPYGLSYAGQAYVLFGRSAPRGDRFPPFMVVSSLLPENGGDGSTGFVLTGHNDREGIGGAFDGAGDMNGDGINDLLIGAPGASSDPRVSTGETFVFFGRDTTRGDSFPAVFNVNTLLPANGGDASLGFAIFGIAKQDYAGLSVRGRSDFNGDGFTDIVIGARSDGVRGLYEGEAYVFFGRPPSASTVDSDGDGATDDVDLCPRTAIPDPLPGQLRMGRFALANDDHAFDLRTPLGNASKDITTVMTRGCSCTQIVQALGHGPGEVLIGCSQPTLQTWLQSLVPPPGT